MISIEALTILELTRKQILPAVSAYAKELSEAVIAKKAACPAASCEVEEALIEKLSSLNASLFGKANTLDEALLGAKSFEEIGSCASYYHDTGFAAMHELRAVADELELSLIHISFFVQGLINQKIFLLTADAGQNPGHVLMAEQS